jgi:hypothetical protein
MLRAIALLPLLPLFAAACSSEPAAPAAAPVNEKCPNVHIDKMATDWIVATGDPKNRLRITETEQGYTAWLTDGFFVKREYNGIKREKDVKFTEVPVGKRKARIDRQEENLIRFYAKPTLSKCALQTYFGVVDASGTEQVSPVAKEYLAFPKTNETFSFQPPNEPLFLGKAATDKATADAELEAQGEANGLHQLGTIPVGVWSKAAEDGDASCSYEMDLYFDGMLIEGGKGLAAGPVNGEFRHWTYTWDAPYSGNHNFELYRYRKCGEERDLLGIAGTLASLG